MNSSVANRPDPVPQEPRLFQILSRHAAMLVAIGLGVAVVGLLRGFQHRALPARTLSPAVPARDTNIPQAVVYSQLPEANLRPNAKWQSNLTSLRSDLPGIFDTVNRTEEGKLAALEDRSKNRAFDGAPPTIPHPVQSSSDNSCLVCHGQGIKVEERIASKVSHPHYTGCTQCHVESQRSELPAVEGVPVNSFEGLFRAGPGTRATPGAPPTIPHTTWMRQECNSCHGLVARPGLRTTHPWLSSCTQCHAPSAALDQVAFPLPWDNQGH